MFAVLAILAVAIGSFTWNVLNRNDDTVAPKNAAKIETQKTEMLSTCDKSETFCTMQYQPANCEIRIQERSFTAQGTNACSAVKALKKSLCDAGVSEVSKADFETVNCKQLQD